MSRTLVVFRHAKAEPGGAAVDHERRLTGRGRRDAAAAGRLLAGAGVRPDLTLCSTASRARETWELAAAQLGGEPPTSYDRGVYEADWDDLLRIVRDTPAEIATLALVGHNPAMQKLVLALAGHGADDAMTMARRDFGTAAVAVLALPAGWVDVVEGQATLASMTVARG